MRHTPLGCLGLATLALTGCGNLSNEDLLFLAALPEAEDVALEVAVRGTRNALTADAVGDDAVMIGGATDLATLFNGVTGELLTFVDDLGRGAPPTERRADARIWGPASNVDGSGLTMRLEISREELATGRRYHYCLHFARDEEVGEHEPTCAEPSAPGYRTLLVGSFDPRVGSESARSGAGVLRLDFEALHLLGVGKADEHGTLELTYDFTAGETKQIHLVWTGALTPGSLPEAVAYDYGLQADGRVDFFFQVDNELDPNAPGSNPKSWTVNAAWHPLVGGRADALGRGGDLPVGKSAGLTECWDAALKRTYLVMALSAGGVVEDPPLILEGTPDGCPAL